MKKIETIDICGSGTFPKGNPCHVPNTNIGSYYPNVSSGYNATARSYIGGLDDRFEPFKLTESTNPYLNQSSSFPTFNPPQLPLPQPFFDQLSSNENYNGSGYSLTAIQNLPRIATDTEFAATGHGNIAVESIVHHAVQQNSTGKGINAISSLQMINLSYNKLNDNDLFKLNNGLIGYTLNLKVFNLSYNNFSDAGIDYLIKGLAGVQYLQVGGRELSGVMQGLFTHYNVNITTINLSNNHIGNIGADIISNAIVTNSLPHVKALNLADNNITDTGGGYLAQSFKSEGNKLKVLHLEGNKLNPLHTNPKLIQVVTNMKTHVKILVSRMSDIVDGVKKQGNLFFGSKEDKQAIVKDILKQAQENGVDVKNVTVSKDIFEVAKNLGQLTFNFSVGWVKCKVVPDSVKSFAADQIIAKASPLVGQINTVMDVANCYFESFDENASSKQGVQFIGDLGFITQSEFFGVNE